MFLTRNICRDGPCCEALVSRWPCRCWRHDPGRDRLAQTPPRRSCAWALLHPHGAIMGNTSHARRWTGGRRAAPVPTSS